MRLAEFVETQTEAILADWEAFAATRLPAAHRLSAQALRDDAKALLLHIAADMRTAQSDADRDGKGRGLRPGNAPDVTDVARRRAQHRLALAFTLDQMVSEYRALRASVMRRWTPGLSGGDPDAVAELVRFGESMDQALTESIAWYAARLEDARTLLLGVLGHDLRNPLGAARTSAVYLLRTGRLDDAQTEAAARILHGTTRMRQMVHDLLDYTSTRMGTALPITRLPTDLRRVCREVVDELSAIHPERALRVEHRPGDLEGRWDAKRIDQMVTNLVSNAIQHGAPGTPVTVTLADAGHAVEVAVHNAGAPIAPETLRTLFDPLMRRAVRTGEGREGSSGLGLGLYIARQIAAAHGGELAVRSDAAHGTTFTARLPRGTAAQ